MRGQERGREYRALSGVRPQRLAALDAERRAARRACATNAAAAPAPVARGPLHGRPRHAFSAVAPASTGPATPNDSREASAREYPSARAAASVAPVRETPGPTSAAACASPQRQRRASATPQPAVAQARRTARQREPPPRPRPRRSRQAIRAASISPARRARRPTEPLLDRPLEHVAQHDRRRQARARACAASGRSRRSDGASATQRPEVQRDLKLLPPRRLHSPRPSPAASGTAATCAEDDTGSNSAAPWISPSAATWTAQADEASAAERAAAPPPVAHEQPDRADEDRGDAPRSRCSAGCPSRSPSGHRPACR